jgi:hypothetical protein
MFVEELNRSWHDRLAENSRSTGAFMNDFEIQIIAGERWKPSDHQAHSRKVCGHLVSVFEDWNQPGDWKWQIRDGDQIIVRSKLACGSEHEAKMAALTRVNEILLENATA